MSRHTPSAAWTAARARNALRRRGMLGTVSLAGALATLFVLTVLPREAERALAVRIAALPPTADTARLDRQLVDARAALARRRTAIESATLQRRRDSLFAVPVPDAAGVSMVVAGDTLRAQLAERLAVARASRLAESFLSLAEADVLRDDAVVRALADSLREVERERSAFGALTTADPRYRQLRERVAILGDRLMQLVAARLDAARERATGASAGAPADSGDVDRQRAVQQLVDSVAGLEVARRRAGEWNREREQSIKALRDREPLRAPLGPVLVASVALGVALGFLVTFLVELRQPRLADAAEVIAMARRAGISSTAVIERTPRTTQPRRRAADQLVPPALHGDPSAPQRVHLLLNAIGDVVPLVGVMSARADHAATVGLHLAAAAADVSRAALLIDGDVMSRAVAWVIARPDLPGLADVARERLELAAALTTVITGRDRSITVLGAGPTTTSRSSLDLVAPELLRLVHRFDLTVVALPRDVNAWPAPLQPRDVVLAVTPGLTDVAWLRGALAATTLAAVRVRAILVWRE